MTDPSASRRVACVAHQLCLSRARCEAFLSFLKTYPISNRQTTPRSTYTQTSQHILQPTKPSRKRQNRRKNNQSNSKNWISNESVEIGSWICEDGYRGGKKEFEESVEGFEEIEEPASERTGVRASGSGSASLRRAGLEGRERGRAKRTKTRTSSVLIFV